MTDNLFDRLRHLLETRGPVNWGLAREIAESVAGPAEPVDPWVAEEFEDLTHTAALRIAAASPLDAVAAGAAARSFTVFGLGNHRGAGAALRRHFAGGAPCS